MACTTLLVGKNASYDGSTIMARNEDTPNGMFNVKKLVVVQPEDQPRHYRSVCSHVEMDLPENPLRYTNIPDSTRGDGIWGEAGINEANVAMTATETITTNERVLGADPYIEFQKAVGKEGDDNYQPEIAGGIGEEDLVTIVLPYIKSAREGVIRLGSLLEKYGTYEPNAIGFADADEIWWLETIGGHHWMAKRVPDDCYVTMPNQLGIDEFDLEDALGEHKNICAPQIFVNSLKITILTSALMEIQIVSTHVISSDHVLIPIMFTTHHVHGLCSVILTLTMRIGIHQTHYILQNLMTFHGHVNQNVKLLSKTLSIA